MFHQSLNVSAEDCQLMFMKEKKSLFESQTALYATVLFQVSK